MTVINLFFNLPDEIKTIIWQFDPTYTIVKEIFVTIFEVYQMIFIHLTKVVTLV